MRLINGAARVGWRSCCRCLVRCLCGCCLSLGAAVAAPPGTTEAPTTTDAVQPPQLIEQVELEYPEEATESGAHGDVSVLVTVDAAGQVIDVAFESGPEIFRGAAEDAARGLVFAPALKLDQPVTATTRVWFHFAPAVEAPREPDGPTTHIVVHGNSEDQDDTRARTTLDEAALEQSAGDDLAETITQIAGVRVAQGTSDASKPIIRGQQERRLLVLYDGVRHESQKWGPDHATEIDPFAAGSISVIRGAAGARYGPDAIGGVILVEPPPMRVDPGAGGKAIAAFSTNGRRPYGAARVDVAPESRPGLSLRAEGNVGVGASRSAPTYVLGNTASRSWNLGAAAGYRWGRGQLRASWHHNDLKAGVFYGVSNSSPSDFQDQLEADRPVTADLWSTTYDIDRPYQDVAHDIGTLRGVFLGERGTWEVTYAFQRNHRLEYEQVRDSVTGAQYDFTLRTHSLDALYSHDPLSLEIGDLSGGVGLQGTFQENVYRGYSLMPNYRSFGGGVFAYERLSLARIDLEAGARYDALSRTVYMDEDDYERHVSRGTLDDTKCEERETSARCPTAYDAATVSVGGVLHAVPDRLDLKLDLSSASRFPNADELYLIGSAPSFPVFALGYPDLGVETAWGGSLTAGLRGDWIEAEASGFGLLVQDYIYFAPDLTDDGEVRYEVTIQGTWPQYAYQAIDAAVHGGDGSLTLGTEGHLGLDVRGGVVRARDRHTGAYLIGTPADHVTLSVIGRPPPLDGLREVEIAISTDLVARQSRVNDSADFAPAPDGYALLGASIDAEVGRAPLRVGLQATNLLNTRYREYTSLLRYYADQPGRDVRLRVGADF